MTKIEKTNRGLSKLSIITTIIALISILMLILQNAAQYIDNEILTNFVSVYDVPAFGFISYILSTIPVLLLVVSTILTAIESKKEGNLKPFKSKSFITTAVAVPILYLGVFAMNVVDEFMFMNF